MARVTVVKKAQQRYRTVPVIDPETGQQKQTPVMRGGTQKVTKKDKPVFMRVTEVDKTQPLPNRSCDKCGVEIKVGDSYKWIKPKSGPFGGRMRVRCASCPTWQVWEYSSSLSARLAEISHNFASDLEGVDTPEAATDALSAAAEAVREIATEKEESASNIEEGFGHETSASEELRTTAEELETWADEIEQVDVPDLPEPEEEECTECDGTGQVDTHEGDTPVDGEQEACKACDGTGQFTPEEPTEEQIFEWLSEVEDACSIVDESPV